MFSYPKFDFLTHKAWSEQQLGMTVASDQAAKLFDSAVRQLVSWIECEQLGGLEATMAQMHESEPKFCNPFINAIYGFK